MTTSSSWQAKVLQEAKRLREDSLYSYKAHYNQAEIWERRHLWLGIPAAALAAVAGAMATTVPTWAVTTLAFSSAALTAALTVVNPSERARASRNAGDSLQAYHERLRRWSENDLPELPQTKGRLDLEAYGDEKSRLNKAAPGIGRVAQLRAKRGIEAGEADHVAGDP